MPDAQAQVALAFRENHGRAIAVLTRVLGDLDLAEDAVQEAYVVALRTWPGRGVPPSPAGWIVTTARRRAVDRWRREQAGRAKASEAALLFARGEPEDAPDAIVEAPDVRDDQLRLVFTCCHPALSLASRVALTLRLIGGLTTAEIARALLVPEPTMAARLTRAKAKIRDAAIPYRVPPADELAARLTAVLAVVYLVYTEGHRGTSGDELVRVDLCTEALRLARELADLVPGESEVHGLLALLLLSEARRPARTDAEGRLVPLPAQDRSAWDRGLVEQGNAALRRARGLGAPGPYRVQAEIAAVHDAAERPEDTDWPRIVELYDALLTLTPTPVVRLNRAVAVAEVDGPDRGLAALEGVDLPGYRPWHVVRAELLVRSGRVEDGVEEFRRALECPGSEPETALLRESLGRLTR